MTPLHPFRKIDLAVVLLGAIVCFYGFRRVPTAAPYLTDEADYMAAVSRGVAANVLEQPSMSLPAFLKTGLGMGIDRSKRGSLSELVRGSKDITFLRHYHGPVYFYWLAAVAPLVHEDEYRVRWSGLILHFLTFLVIYVGALQLVETGPRSAALLASFLFLFSSSALGTVARVSPHVVYVFFTVLTLVLFARFLESGATGWWYAAGAACALAFCSVEYAILLPVTFAVCLFAFRRRVALTRPAMLRSALIFFGGILLLWPFGILKLSAIKSYFFIAYLALMRPGSYGTDSALSIWWQRFAGSPLEYSLAILCAFAALYGFRRLGSRHLLLPCLVYAGLMLLTTLKNTSLNPTYVVSILPPLAMVSGIVIAFLAERLPAPARIAAVTVLLLAITLDGFRRLPPPATPDPALPNLLASIRRDGIDRSSALVPFDVLPTLAYYFPSMQLHPYLPTDDSASILEKIRAGGYGTFVYARNRNDDLSTTLGSTFPRAERIASSPMTLYVNFR